KAELLDLHAGEARGDEVSKLVHQHEQAQHRHDHGVAATFPEKREWIHVSSLVELVGGVSPRMHNLSTEVRGSVGIPSLGGDSCHKVAAGLSRPAVGFQHGLERWRLHRCMAV